MTAGVAATAAPPLATLVSVRDVAEARIAAAAGVDFIDLKDPARGALGALPLVALREVVQALRAPGAHAGRSAATPGFAGRISATVGDWPFDAAQTPQGMQALLATLIERVQAVAACGVDFVKVGVPAHAIAGVDRVDPGPAVLQALAALRLSAAQVVPVLVVDDGLALQRVDEALALGFRVLMLDTADKAAGSLLQRLPQALLQRFVQQVRSAGGLPGLAGALRLEDVPALRRLAPGFAGFRSAVCPGSRAGALCLHRLGLLLLAAVAVAPSPEASSAQA